MVRVTPPPPPTHTRLYDGARRSLVALAGKAGIDLRQNYNRLAPRLAARAGRHAHARQFRRMRRALRTLKGYKGRVLRDIGRKIGAGSGRRVPTPNGEAKALRTPLLGA